MTINTLDGIFNALANNSSRVVLDKASIAYAAAGQFHSLWRATGQPGQGAIPTTAAVCQDQLIGCMNFAQQVDPSTSYLGYFEAVCSNSAVTLEIHDRLMHLGGLNGTLATAQAASVDLSANLANSNLAARIGDPNYSDVQWWLEWYTDTGATATTVTVNVTYNDGTTGNLTAASLTATRRASFLLPLNGLIPAAASGKYIRAVNTVQLTATTGTAGNLGVTATRPRASLGCPVANNKWSADWASLPVSETPNDSCLFVIQIAGATSTGTVRGGGKIAHG
jgi:hypothetical protein